MNRLVLALVLFAATSASACKGGLTPRKYSSNQAQVALADQFEKVSLVLGEFPVNGAESVVDGDTIRVEGLKSSIRMLGIDTEETFKHKEEKLAFQEGWEPYKKKMRGDSAHPVKMATPIGEDAKKFAEKFFTGVTTVRLERDHPGEIRDFYGRFLAYVIGFKDGKWVNYNIECVRAGLSPYFSKYGYSRRFHQEFVAAQKAAQEAKIGIWNPALQHYDDYEERLKWWNARGDAVQRFEDEAKRHDNWFALTRFDTWLKIDERLGKEVVVFGGVGEIKPHERGPTVVKLSRNRTSSLDLVFFDKDVFLSTGLSKATGEFVRARGVVHRKQIGNGPERLQIVVSLPNQISLESGKSHTPTEESAEDDAE